MTKGAIIEGNYRYRLWRIWDKTKQVMVWIMLNPSTADAEEDDPTIRRCMGFARSNGCGSINVVNLYAYRTTDPKELLKVQDPIGPENDHWLSVTCAQYNIKVVCGWGNFEVDNKRANVVMQERKKFDSLYRFGPTTKSGQPRHPLYLKRDLPLVPHP